jgi:hypothetical protein
MVSYREIATRTIVSFAVMSAIECGGGNPPRALAPTADTATKMAPIFRHDGAGLFRDIEPRTDGSFVAVSTSHICRSGNSAADRKCTPLRLNPFAVHHIRLATGDRGDVTQIVAGYHDDKTELVGLTDAGAPTWRRAAETPYSFGLSGDGTLILPGVHATKVVRVATGALKAELPFASDRADALELATGETIVVSMSPEGMMTWSTAAGRTMHEMTAIDDYVIVRSFDQRVASLVALHGETLLILSSDGKIVARTNLSGKNWSSALPNLHLRSASAVTAADGDKFVILLGGRGGWHRTLLLILESDGRLTSDYVVEGDLTTTAPVPNGSSILVGGRDVVYKLRV